MADRIAARCDHAQMASKTCQESARPPVQGGRPSSCLRRGVGRYSIKFTDHGWHHEPHSPVKTSCVESGTHPKKHATSDGKNIMQWRWIGPLLLCWLTTS